MSTVLQMVRTLTAPPVRAEFAGLNLRQYAGTNDISHWLRVRHEAFAREKLGVRRWDEADFRRELLAKDWWSAERMWFAQPDGESAESGAPIGTVTWALRGTGEDAIPVVHWLAVVPRWRRRGVARLLMSALEASCWENGYREIRLETHDSWTAAVAFYETLGYGVVS